MRKEELSMKYLDNSKGIDLLRMSTRSSSSSKNHHKGLSVFNKITRFRGLSLGIAISALLVAYVWSSSTLDVSRSVAAQGDVIGTFQSNDCSTPKSEWNL